MTPSEGPSRRGLIASAALVAGLSQAHGGSLPPPEPKKSRVHGRVYWGARALVMDLDFTPDEAKDIPAAQAAVVAALRDLAGDLERSQFSVRAVALQFSKQSR